MKKRTYISLFLFLSLQVFSKHIVGGEMIYNYLGNNKYQLILKIYRDCGDIINPGFDGSAGPIAYVSVYDASENVIGVFNIGDPIVTLVPSAFTNPCVIPDGNVCIEEGIYTSTLTLPPKAGGYTIIYQACCRNGSVDNLSAPGTYGATYYTKIPGPENGLANNSPRFSKFPPIYLCDGVNFQFDHSAVDPDGDELIYSLCAPYMGLSNCCANIKGIPQCGSPCDTVALPPPYLPVPYSGTYSAGYPIASNPAFIINPATGLLSGTPNKTGHYVVCVCIQEIRNNVVINTHYRDFQFTVIPCEVSVLSAAADQPFKCQGQTIHFYNQSINESINPQYSWDFGVPNLSTDTSSLFNTVYTYPDTGVYVMTLITNPGKPCSDTLQRNVYVYPLLDVNFPKQKGQCFSNNSFNFSAKGSYASQATFFWNFAASASPSTAAYINPGGIHFTQAGLFQVKLKARQFSCVDTFIDTVRVFPKPKARINNLQNLLCDPALVGFSNGSSSYLPVKYSWTFSNGKTSNEFEPLQIFTPPGNYEATLLVETTSPCRDTSSFRIANILVNPSPTAGFLMEPKETSIFEPDITIKSLATFDVVKTDFDFGDGQSSSELLNKHTYSTFGDYRIAQTVVNQYGCIDSISDLLKILPEFRFWIPNTFSPDGNERNDFFMPSTYGVTLYRFEIFDRWGKSLFKTNKPEEGWNGSDRGVACPQGIYIWKISFKNEATQQNESHFGHVTLIRNH